MDIRLLLVQKLHALLAKAGRGGSLPGEVALRLDPKFLSRFQLPKDVVLVTGTNGKTTTSNLVAESLRACGKCSGRSLCKKGGGTRRGRDIFYGSYAVSG